MTLAEEELHKRLQDSEGCTSSIEPDLDGGVLEALLKELNEKGRLYRSSGYLSNAVEKPDELRVAFLEGEDVSCFPALPISPDRIWGSADKLFCMSEAIL